LWVKFSACGGVVDSIRKIAKGVYGLPVPVFEVKTDCKCGATDATRTTGFSEQSIVPNLPANKQEEEPEIF
jgi:hypothetical protein